jgi:hypothetical protein
MQICNSHPQHRLYTGSNSQGYDKAKIKQDHVVESVSKFATKPEQKARSTTTLSSLLRPE